MGFAPEWQLRKGVLSCLRVELRGGIGCQRSPVIFVLRKRSDFLEMARRGVFIKGRYMFLQACVAEVGRGARGATDNGNSFPEIGVNEPVPHISEAEGEPVFPLFYGITASRKVSNAVNRNKVKRRIRVLIRDRLRLCDKDYKPRDFGGNSFTLSKKTIAGMVTEKHRLCCINSAAGGAAGLGFVFVFVATKRTPLAQWSDLQEDFQRLVNDGIRRLKIGR